MTDIYSGPERRANSESSDLWTRRFTAWGSMAVTFAIFVLLAYDLIATSRLEDKQAFNGLNETIKAMAMIAVGFWLGSSNSKQKQDDVIASTTAKQTETTRTAINALATSVPTTAAIPVATTTVTETAAGTTTTSTEPTNGEKKT